MSHRIQNRERDETPQTAAAQAKAQRQTYIGVIFMGHDGPVEAVELLADVS